MSLFDKECAKKHCFNITTKNSYCPECRKSDRAIKSATKAEFFLANIDQIEAFKFGLSDQEKLRVTIEAIKALSKIIKDINPAMYESYQYLTVEGMGQ